MLALIPIGQAHTARRGVSAFQSVGKPRKKANLAAAPAVAVSRHGFRAAATERFGDVFLTGRGVRANRRQRTNSAERDERRKDSR
jgi:hypothetical protein